MLSRDASTIVFSTAIAWEMGIEFWRAPSNAIVTIMDIPPDCIWEITIDNRSRRTGPLRRPCYLHPQHPANNGRRLPN